MGLLTESTVRTPEEALSYSLECQLATVNEMIMRKSPARCALERQLLITASLYGFCVNFNASMDLNRCRELHEGYKGNVRAYAAAVRKSIHPSLPLAYLETK